MSNNEILESNIDKTIHHRDYVERKPRTVNHYEWSWFWPVEPTFGSSIVQSILKGFSSVFEYTGLPEGIRAEEFNLHLIQAGRMKTIKVGNEFYPVHIVPKKFNHYGDYVESTIIEPYLPGLSGKTTEKFKNVEWKNDVLGQSIIRLIYPFVNAIDDALFNLNIQQQLLAGKYIYITDKVKKGDNKEDENSMNQFLTNGKPVKQIAVSLMDNGELPIKKIEIDDSTQSFIDTIQFNYNQMLNILGIPNNNAEGKRERMITSEIAIQNILQSSILEDMFNMRQRAVEQFNKVFGTNVTVSIRAELEVELEDAANVEESENE